MALLVRAAGLVLDAVNALGSPTLHSGFHPSLEQGMPRTLSVFIWIPAINSQVIGSELISILLGMRASLYIKHTRQIRNEKIQIMCFFFLQQ